MWEYPTSGSIKYPSIPNVKDGYISFANIQLYDICLAYYFNIRILVDIRYFPYPCKHGVSKPSSQKLSINHYYQPLSINHYYPTFQLFLSQGESFWIRHDSNQFNKLILFHGHQLMKKESCMQPFPL